MLDNFVVGQSFPRKLPPSEGAIAEFLKEDGNQLLMYFPDLSDYEIDSVRFGKVEVGLLVENSAIMLVWRFHDKAGTPMMFLDTTFNVRLLEKPVLTNIMSREERLFINIFLVDARDKQLKAIRSITLPKETTLEFSSAVMEQFQASDEKIRRQIDRWMMLQPDELAEAAEMRQMGL